jgi:hypothetical protein
MNKLIERIVGEAAYTSSGVYSQGGKHHDTTKPGSPEIEFDPHSEPKEVELASTILSAAAQMPDSPAKDKIIQAATELKQMHASL